MTHALPIAVALVASHVLGESLRPFAGSRRVRAVSLAAVVGAAAYLAAGQWTWWPVPVVALLLFAAGGAVRRRAPESVAVWTAWHVGVLAAVALLSGLVLPALVSAGHLQAASPVWARGVYAALAAATGLVASVGLGSEFMNRATRPFAVAMRGERVVEAGGQVLTPLENGFPSGGRVIGQYERLLIFLFVLADAPTAIGFLVAAKSILRFGEIQNGRERKNAEYILIGTLMSFAYALVVAYGTRLVLAHLGPP